MVCMYILNGDLRHDALGQDTGAQTYFGILVIICLSFILFFYFLIGPLVTK